MLDSGSAMSVCPVDYFPECRIRPSRRIELQAADGSPVAALEDAGWRFAHQVDRLVLRRGDLSLQVDRVDNVYWLFDLEGAGQSKACPVGGPRLWSGGDRVGTPAGAKAGIVA